MGLKIFPILVKEVILFKLDDKGDTAAKNIFKKVLDQEIKQSALKT